MMAAGEKEGSEEEDLQVAMVMKMGCCPSGYNALNVDPMALSSDLENESQDAGALFVLESKGVIYSSFIHSFTTLAIPPIFGAFFLWIVSPKWPLYSHWECGNIYCYGYMYLLGSEEKYCCSRTFDAFLCTPLSRLGALCILTGIVAEYVVTGYGSYATET